MILQYEQETIDLSMLEEYISKKESENKNNLEKEKKKINYKLIKEIISFNHNEIYI